MYGIWNIKYLKFFKLCRHLLSAVIESFTGSFPKNSIVSDFSGEIHIPKCFPVFFGVNTALCKSSFA